MATLKDKFISESIFYGKKIYLGHKLFVDKKVSMYAAASAFYAIICFFPLGLCLISILSFIAGDQLALNEFFIKVFLNYLPKIDEGVKTKLIQVLTGGSVSQGLNFFNLCFLLLSSLGLFRAILVGIHIIREKTPDKAISLYWKSILGVMLVFSMLLTQFFVTPLLLSAKKFLSSLNLLSGESNTGILLLDIFLDLATYLFTHAWIVVFKFSFSFLFMTLVYYLIFYKKAKLRDCVLGSSLFVICIELGKSFFWVYIDHVRERLVISYGDFFSIAILILWIFFLFICFFYNACLVSAKP